MKYILIGVIHIVRTHHGGWVGGGGGGGSPKRTLFIKSTIFPIQNAYWGGGGGGGGKKNVEGSKESTEIEFGGKRVVRQIKSI